MTSRVGFAVFGMGTMGLEHVQNIIRSPRASLKWLVRNNVEDAKTFVDTFSLQTRCTTPDNISAVLEDPGVDAVMIVSPSVTHEPLITASLNAGKAVFCEKPVTVDIDSTRECFRLAERQRKPLMCAFNRRFDPSFVNVYQKIRSGSIGPLRIVKTVSRDLKPPPISYVKSSGGIVTDSTIHDIDLCCWMVNARPKTVFATGQAFDPEIGAAGDLDQVVVTITFDNGVMCVIDNGRVGPYGYDQRLEVLCEKGMLSVDNRPTNLVTSHDEVTTSCPRIDNHYLGRYSEAYKEELEHFIDVVEDRDTGKAELRVTEEDTLRAMNLVRVCNESIQQRRPVDYTE